MHIYVVDLVAKKKSSKQCIKIDHFISFFKKKRNCSKN